MSAPKIGVDEPDLTPITSPELRPLMERSKIHAVPANMPTHKPSSLAQATLSTPPPPTPTYTTQLPPTEITPLSCPTPKYATRITGELGECNRQSYRLCAELGFHRAYVHIRRVLELAMLQPRVHLDVGLLRHFCDHGAPVTMTATMAPERLCDTLR